VIALGLTGSIATGKSTALAAFAALGVPVFSSDEAVHALYMGGPAAERIEALFPGATSNGAVDRAELGRRLVARPDQLPALEAAIHPLVRDRIASFLAEAQRSGAALAVVDIPLLFETGHDYGLDAVAVTTVDDETQRRRALARPGMTVEKLATILARQMPQAEKIKRADYVIDSSGNIADSARQVRDIVTRLNSAGTA
jgi:dephospho-CoA kinase